MPFEPGQILLVEFPFTDRTSAKMRPVLVVSSTEFNRGEDFAVVPISSRLDGGSNSLPITSTCGYFRETGLKCDSTVKWTKVTTISGVVVRRRLGRIPADLLRQVQELVRGIFMDG